MSLEDFIVLRNCSTCCRHSYAHYQDPETILVVVCGTWCSKDGRIKIEMRISVKCLYLCSVAFEGCSILCSGSVEVR
jgi:hypothetical protein